MNPTYMQINDDFQRLAVGDFFQLDWLLYYDRMITYVDEYALDSLLKLNGFSPKHRTLFLRLMESNILIPSNRFFPEEDVRAFPKFSDPIFMSNRTATGISETAVLPRSFIFDEGKIDRAVRSLHSHVRHLTNLASQRGANVVAFYPLESFHYAIKDGPNELLSIVYSRLPRIDLKNLNVELLVDFLKDEQTQIKRRRLWSWQNGIETKIERGEIRIEHIPDLIATQLDDYVDWLRMSELKFKYGVFESLLVISANIIAGLTLLGLPKAVENLMQFKKRELQLLEDEMKAPGRELAYIVHAYRGLDVE